MLDRYRPRQFTAQEDAARTARMAVEHDRARDRFLAAERRKRVVAILMVCLALGGGAGFFAYQWYANSALHTVQTNPGKPAPGKDLVNQSAVREAVYRALQSRGMASQKGDRGILSDGHERRELDLRPPEKRQKPPAK